MSDVTASVVNLHDLVVSLGELLIVGYAAAFGIVWILRFMRGAFLWGTS